MLGASPPHTAPREPYRLDLVRRRALPGALDLRIRICYLRPITEPGSLPLGALATWLAQWIWAPGFGLILVFLPLLFPDGSLPSRRWRPVAWLGGLSMGL